MIRITALAIALMVCCASSTFAQSSWDINAMAGYTLPVELDHAARGVDSTSIGPGPSWQFAIGRNIGPRWGAEVFWTEQFTAYRVESGGTTGELFDMSLIQLHGDLQYRFGRSGSRLEPFAFVGLGSTFFRATDVPNETKMSMGFGAGIKYFLRKELGLRGQFRYKSTFLNDASSTDFCDPFGFCQSTLGQFEFAGGVTFRF